MDPNSEFSGAPEKRFDLRQLQPWNNPEQVTENERLLGGLSYVSQIVLPLVLPIIVLLTDEAKRSQYLRYHAVHSLALLAASVVYWLGALLVFLLIVMIMPPCICGAWVLFVPPVVVLVYYGWQAFLGRAPIVPWLSELLQKYNLL